MLECFKICKIYCVSLKRNLITVLKFQKIVITLRNNSLTTF